jgi:pyruvate carboxylase
VIDMLSGGLGWPEGGWPEAVSRVVLGEKRHQEARAKYEASAKANGKGGAAGKGAAKSGAGAKASHAVGADALKSLRTELAEKLRREPTEDELYSYLMYPQVFTEFAKQQRESGDVSVLPTPAFFYGMKPGEEITVEIEEGKTLIIRLVSIGAPDKDARRSLSYELNGMSREAYVIDKSIAPKTKSRPKADPADPMQVAAPIPGLIAALTTSVGAKVSKGDKLFMVEAMKMQTTVYAPADGIVTELHVAVGDTVESKDLLVKLKTKS